MEIFNLAPWPDYAALDFLFRVYQVANPRETLTKIVMLWNMKAESEPGEKSPSAIRRDFAVGELPPLS